MSKDAFFNRYEIDIREGRLGGGSFAEVFKAYDNEKDQVVAIKVAPVKYVNGKIFDLTSEFNVTKDLPVHKNIANYEAVYRLEMPNGLFDYAIMQYYPEGNLKELLASVDLTVEEKQHIVDGILKGLNYLHTNDIIHRDIKPSNILISKRKGEYTPKIADFGLSKIANAKEREAFTNSFGGGTLEYSSPEQLLGEDLRYNADLWAFGVIAYQLFVGRIPFSAKDSSGSSAAKRKSIYQNIVNAPIPSDISTCPEPYRELITRCLVKDPKQRIQSASACQSILNIDTQAEEYDDDETIVLELKEGRSVVGADKKSKLSEDWENYKRLTVGLIILLITLLGWFLLKPSGSGGTTNAIQTDKSEKIMGDESINEMIRDNPELQDDESFINKMKNIREQEEINIWALAKEEDSIHAYEQYLILYPKGLFRDNAELRIKEKLSSLVIGDEEDAWQSALASNTISGFNKIIDNYPTGAHVNEAKFRISILQRKIEEDQWNKIKYSNSLEDFKRHISLFPEGKFIDQAKKKKNEIEKDIEVAKAYRRAMKLGTVEALETFLLQYPATRYTAEVNTRKEELSREAKQNLEIKTHENIDDKHISATENSNKYGFVEDTKSIEIESVPNNTKVLDNSATSDNDIAIEKSIPKVEKSKESGNNAFINNRENDMVPVPPLISSLDSNMVELSATTYKLGCDQGCDSDAQPSKTVSISPFKMSRYEVTQADYESVMGNNPSFFKGCGDCPVENISFYDALQYIEKLNNMPGNPYKFRLPTEAEWEYAASANTKFKYAGGNDIDGVAIYRSNSGRGTAPVNSKKTNKFLLRGMSGNVYEWCDSWYSAEGYDANADKNLQVIRGGSWNSKASDCEVKKRGKTTPNDKRPFIGMRLVRDL